MVKQNIRTRKNNQRKEELKYKRVADKVKLCVELESILSSTEGTGYLTGKGTTNILDISPEPDACSKVDISNVKITEEIIKESIKDLKSLLINNDLFEEDRKQFTFNCFKISGRMVVHMSQ